MRSEPRGLSKGNNSPRSAWPLSRFNRSTFAKLFGPSNQGRKRHSSDPPQPSQATDCGRDPESYRMRPIALHNGLRVFLLSR